MGTSTHTTKTTSRQTALTIIVAGLVVSNAFLFLLLLVEPIRGAFG